MCRHFLPQCVGRYDFLSVQAWAACHPNDVLSIYAAALAKVHANNSNSNNSNNSTSTTSTSNIKRVPDKTAMEPGTGCPFHVVYSLPVHETLAPV